MFETLQKRLNKYGRGITPKQLEECGVKVSAATIPVNSFIGKFNSRRIYAWHNSSNNEWIIERA